jgi:tyrosyl-tRNA synthetase
VALTMPILVGLDGERKMSKSLGNYIGITDAPGDMFGKIMSVSDEVMWSYYDLLTDFTEPVIVRLREEVRTGVLHPKKAKVQLAHTIVAGFHGEDAAKKAADEFERIFSERQAPEQMTELTVERRSPTLAFLIRRGKDSKSSVALSTQLGDREKLTKLLVLLGEVTSKSEADRLVKQKAVEINDKVITDVGYDVSLARGMTYVVRIGKKRFFRLTFE